MVVAGGVAFGAVLVLVVGLGLKEWPGPSEANGVACARRIAAPREAPRPAQPFPALRPAAQEELAADPLERYRLAAAV